MNARGIVTVAVALAAVLCAIVALRPGPAGDRAEDRRGEPAARIVDASPPASRAAVPIARSEAPPPLPPPARPIAAPVAAAPPIAPDAAASLAFTVRDGDARSPPLAPRADVVDEPPTTNELADPAAYRRYESRRQARIYRAFEREASGALVAMRRDIARARAAGVPAEQIAEGEEKAQRLAQTLQRLRDADIGTND